MGVDVNSARASKPRPVLLLGALIFAAIAISAFLLWRWSGSSDAAADLRWPHVVKFGTSCGLIDETGRYVVNPRFDAIDPPSGNLYPVSQGGRWGVIDASGAFVVEPRYDWATTWPYLGPRLEGVHVMQNERWGIVDTGGVHIQPAYLQPLVFLNGHAVAMTARDGGQIRRLEDIASVSLVDRSGRSVLNSRDWLTISPMGDDTYAVADRAQQWFLVDRQGRHVPGTSFQELRVSDELGIAGFKREGKWGLVNSRGEIIRAPTWDELGWRRPRTTRLLFNEWDMAPARLGDRWGFVDRRGEWVVQPQFRGVDGFGPDGLILVDGGGQRFGMIDRQGRYVLNPSQERMGSIATGGLIPIGTTYGRNGAFQRWGFVDRQGRVVAEPQFSGFALPRRAGLPTAVNVSPPTFASATMGVDEFGQVHMVSQASIARWGFIDDAGQMSIAPAYEDARPFDESGLAGVKQNGRWGFINTQGHWVIQPQFDAIECPGQRPEEQGPD